MIMRAVCAVMPGPENFLDVEVRQPMAAQYKCMQHFHKAAFSTLDCRFGMSNTDIRQTSDQV